MTDLTQQQRTALGELVLAGESVAEVFRVIEMIAEDVTPEDREDLLDALAEACNRQAEFLRAVGSYFAGSSA